jgi:hypothetical protein
MDDFIILNFRRMKMPMIDVYAAADLFPAGTDRQLGEELTLAVLRAEGVISPGPFHANNTAVYIHRMDQYAIYGPAAVKPYLVARASISGLSARAATRSALPASVWPLRIFARPRP